MKTRFLSVLIALSAGSLLAAEPADEVKAAISKLADQPNYSWKTSVENAGGGGGRGGGRFGGGPSEGKAEKGGAIIISTTFGDFSSQVIKKGEKGALSGQDGWQSLAELQADDQGFGAFQARRIEQARSAADEAKDLLEKSTGIQMADGAYAATLKEDAVQQLMAAGRGGRRGGGAPPAATGAKGSVKFWLKDGMLSKYSFQVQGTREGRDGQQIEINRTTTVEISNVGTTKVEIPAEAQSKL